ncbi:CD3324 family protein [Anaeromicropila herbilytica]|uniref:Mor transcription activator domain-containing protein n=1 Tax=Anaeromicropila herbilytica TaxID=2785025 RepID=A0A7R7EKY5_9FIRM|nr:CD3324 family protein [Anaeromicropila herbilytica]BCN30605.1 hypothetical protein bsdtb5_19000 [Anaeromicropila herbilytica]
MSYQKAINVLPIELVEQIQQYIDGEYVYIPRRDEKKKSWGTNTTIRSELRNRNESIFDDYQSGISVNSIADKYFLSEKSIQRILRQQKNMYIVNQS